MILKPLSDFLKVEVTADRFLPVTLTEASLGGSTDTYNKIQDEMLQESLNNQAEAQISGICAAEGFKLIAVEVKASGDYSSLQALFIKIRRINSGSRPFIYIEPSASDESPEIKRIKNTLSEVYNMSLNNIHITEIE